MMRFKYLSILFGAAFMTACTDSGEFDRNEDSNGVSPTVVNSGNNMGSVGGGGQDGIAGIPDVPAADSPSQDPQTPTDTNPENSNTGTNDSENTAPPTEESGDDTDSDAENELISPVQGDGTSQFLVPGDCSQMFDTQGTSYCISAAAGNRLFAISPSGILAWSSRLSEQGQSGDSTLILGEHLFVLRRATGSGNNRVLTAFDSEGYTLYEAVLSGDLLTLEAGIFDAPHLFLHTRNSNGDSRVTQIDGASGRQSAILDFPGQSVEAIDLETSGDTRFLAARINGVTQYFDAETLEAVNRVFMVDPTNYQTVLPELMNKLRMDYLGDYLTLLRQTNQMVGLANQDSEVTCTDAGNVEILSANSYVSESQFTRAYRFADCEMNGTTVNGTLIHSLLELDTASGTSGTESFSFDSVSITLPSTPTVAADDSEVETITESKTLSGQISSVYVLASNDVSAEMTFEIERYRDQNSAGNSVTISAANYTRMISTDDPAVGPDGFKLTESGSMNYVNADEVTTTVELQEPLTYLRSNPFRANASLDDAPIRGLISVDASDGSAMIVDANRAGVNMQNYFLTQRGTTVTVDDIWTVPAVSTQLRIVE